MSGDLNEGRKKLLVYVEAGRCVSGWEEGCLREGLPGKGDVRKRTWLA